jgi:predicted dehydrogenase
MKILIVGVGSIGKRHLNNLIETGRQDICICDNQRSRIDEVLEKYPALRAFEDYREGLGENPEVVFICTPPHLHTQIMAESVERGSHIFCEKPLAMALKGLDSIDKEAREKGLTIMVGYIYRHCKPIKKIKEIMDSKVLGKIYSARTIVSLYLPDWHPWEDYRDFFLSQKAIGGGSLLEESHAVDYIRWLMGVDVHSVFCFNKKLSDLEMDCEDMTVMTLGFEDGSVASIQIDLLGRVLRKEAEFIGEKGTVIWDNERGLVRLYTVERGSWEEFNLAFTPDAYIEQIEHFFQCIKENKDPLITLADATETLRICLAGFKSSDERRLVRPNEINETTVVERIV